ncbi:DUF6210 family protein [Kitasatospora sp. NPDC048545]|uniref:DUF6210 family protein n=1 Tax=Kitasatospora sp. NPDC048545 TaxID=3157208 RepID=UPI0033D25E18
MTDRTTDGTADPMTDPSRSGPPKRHVYLDPDGCGGGWVFVIVAAPTGVVYRTQCGGYACAQYEQEGYLSPHYGTDLDTDLKAFFVGELKGYGTRGRMWQPDELARLRSLVDDLGIYGADRYDELYPPSLVLDESRLAELAEAWVPVVTPDGPGVLVWENSD